MNNKITILWLTVVAVLLFVLILFSTQIAQLQDQLEKSTKTEKILEKVVISHNSVVCNK
jgi:heme/copper-type cytochrome/quinol oxidase subunit 2